MASTTRMLGVTVALGAVLLGACSAAETGPPLAHYQGRSVADVLADTTPEVERRVVDTSIVFGQAAGYQTEGIEDPAWTVLTICADAPTVTGASIVEMAVVPQDIVAAHPTLIQDARAGDYQDLLFCTGVTYGAGTGEIPKTTS